MIIADPVVQRPDTELVRDEREATGVRMVVHGAERASCSGERAPVRPVPAVVQQGEIRAAPSDYVGVAGREQRLSGEQGHRAAGPHQECGFSIGADVDLGEEHPSIAKLTHGVAGVPRQGAAQGVARRVADAGTGVPAEESREDGHATPRGDAGAETTGTPSAAYGGTAGPSTYRRCHVEKQSSAHRIPSRL